VDAGGIRTTSALSINPLLVAIANGFTIGVNTHTFILCAANYRNENEISVISYMYVKYAGVNQNGFCCFFSFLFTWGTHYRDVTGHSIHTQTGKKNQSIRMEAIFGLKIKERQWKIVGFLHKFRRRRMVCWWQQLVDEFASFFFFKRFRHTVVSDSPVKTFPE